MDRKQILELISLSAVSLLHSPDLTKDDLSAIASASMRLGMDIQKDVNGPDYVAMLLYAMADEYAVPATEL